MIYFDEPFLTIHWDETIKCVIMQWKGFAQSNQLRTGLNKGLELIKQKKATYWLADLRNLKVISLEDQKWSNEDWFPRALATELRRMAIVEASSAVTQLGVKNIMSRVNGQDLEVHYFSDVEQAKQWLGSK